MLLGRCSLDPESGELRNAQGELAGLRKQGARRSGSSSPAVGEVVNKDDLMTQVWPKVGVGPGSLTQAIARSGVCSATNRHRIVRNVARRGYMLVPDPPPLSAIETPRAPSAGPPANSGIFSTPLGPKAAGVDQYGWC